MRAVRLIARREFVDTLHSLWLVGFGALFALLTVGISYYGLANARNIGFQGFDLVATSLLNLVLVTVPLVALAQASLSLLREQDDLVILLTQAVSRWEILAGRYLGMVAAVFLTLAGGLALGGLAIINQAGTAHWGDFLLLMLLSTVLIGVFTAIGTVIATLWRDRARALGVGLSVWFVLVILYDLAVFGLAASGTALPLRTLLLAAIVLNPVDAVRVGYLLATGNHAFVGATGAVLAETLGGPGGLMAIGAVLLLWLALSLAVARTVFARQDF